MPYGSVLFDRLIASTRVMGTAGFVIYIADSIGYVGSLGVMAFKDQIASDMSRLEFFRQLTYGMSGLGMAMIALSMVYFLKFHDHDTASDSKELSGKAPVGLTQNVTNGDSLIS